MLNCLKKNVKFFRRYYTYKWSKEFFTQHKNKHPQNNKQYDIEKNINHMNTVKLIFIYFTKVIILFTLTNLVIIKPVSSVLSKSLESFDNNPLIKIISLDFIDNPLTFIRMADYYIAKDDFKKADLYLQYAETLKSRYPSYPKEVSHKIQELKKKIKDKSKN
jgi:hypothetical protein